jgi:hypothetical protein
MNMPHVCDLRPAIDGDTHQVVDQALEQLHRLRDLPADPAVRIHLVSSLLQQGEGHLATAVADATRHGYTDIQIRILLGLG